LDVLAFTAAAFFYVRLRSKITDPLSLDDRLILIIGALIGALAGSRILASFENLNYTISNLSFLVVFSQQTVVGGIIGGIVGVELAKKIKSIKIPTGDIYVFPIILGMMIGRIGCFLTGVSDRTVGLPCSFPWCFNQGDGIPRHPASLYEILFLGLLWIFLYRLNKRMEMQNGVLFRFFVIAYSLYRLFADFIKPRDTLFLGLSPIQAACLLAALFFSLQLAYKYRGSLFVKHTA